MKAALHAVLRRVLPRGLKQRVVSFALKLDRESFVRIAYRRPLAPDMELGLRHLRSRGLQPEHVVDVGAFDGDWAKMARRLWPRSRITMVEANAEKQPGLKKVADTIDAGLQIAVLGSEDGKDVVFHVMGSGSSVLPENSPSARQETTLKTVRLDTLMGDEKPDFIKIDVQGFELEVLKGARNLLQQIQAILIEVSLIPTNNGAPFMSDVVGFMKERGFEVCDVLEMHRRPLDKAINQIDLLFVPATSALLSDTRHY